MPPIAAARQSQTATDNAGVQGSAGPTLLQVPKEKAGGLKKWRSLTRVFDSKKLTPPLRQTSLAINIDRANRAPDDINDFADSDVTQSLYYSPELAAIVSSGGRSKRWAFCLTPTPSEFEQNDQFLPGGPHRDLKEEVSEGSTQSEVEGAGRPTLYLILAPDQDPSCPSQVTMLVGTKEELRGKTGGGDVLEKGL